MKTKNWNGHNIRFVEHNGEWWAVLKDIADALGFTRARDSAKKLAENI